MERLLVQFGGGGFNGVLITVLDCRHWRRPIGPRPLARGFVTYGTDSGHQNAPGVPLQAFALNDEALTNFAYAAYKKVRDVAVELMKRRYGRGPGKLYFFGVPKAGARASPWPSASRRFRRHLQPRAGHQLGRPAGGRHARRRGAVRRRLAWP